jgi:TP901 family phage tail tape measure protein
MASSAGAVRAGGAYVEIFAKDGAFQQSMTRLQNRLKSVGASMRQVGSSMAIGGAAIGTPFVLAAREATGFTLSMAQVRANTNATEEQFGRLQQAARTMGVQMGQSPTEVAAAMSELAKAGLDAEGVIKAIGPVLAVAAADNMELGRAVEVVVSTMSQFGLKASDFGSIADRLQAAANASTTSVDLIGESLSYVGPQAQAAGQSLDDVLAAMGALAQGGIRGSMAGTQLARVLEAMTSEEGKINALGVSVRDSTGNLRPFMDVIRDLGQATKGMNNADRVKAFMDIFDIRGGRAALTLSQLNDEFKRISGEIAGSTGAAASKAAIVLDSFGGAVRRLSAKFADLKIAVITSMGPIATNVVNALGNALTVITRFAEANPRLVATIGLVAGGLLAAGVTLSAFGFAAQGAATGIGVLTAALRIIPALATPAGLAVAGIAAGVGLAVVAARQLSPAFEEETNAIMAAMGRMDFSTAWQIMNVDFAIALTEMAAAAEGAVRKFFDLFADAGNFIADSLIGGIDQFMGVFGESVVTLQAELKRALIIPADLFAAATGAPNSEGNWNEIMKQNRDIDAWAAKEKAKTPEDRAAERAAARQKASDARDEARKAARGSWQGTLDELRRERSELGKTKKDAAAAAEDIKSGVAEAQDRGVMPVQPAAAAAGEAAGGGRTGSAIGTFSAGMGFGVGTELAPGGAAAVSAAAAMAPAAGGQAAAGVQQAQQTQALEGVMKSGFDAMVAAIADHAKITASHTPLLQRIATGIAGHGVEAFT